MSQIWGQANSYARFILILWFIHPICMAVLAYKIERKYRSYEERQKEKPHWRQPNRGR